MHKKLMLACMAIAAFAAFVAAPMVSGAALTSGGSAVAVGTSITGTSTETRFTAGTSTVTCNSADMTGTVTANSGGTVALTFKAGSFEATGTAPKGVCTSSNLGSVKWTLGLEICLHIAKGTDTGTMTGCNGPIIWIFHIQSLGLECKYETASVSGSVTTAPNDAAINVLEQPAKGASTNNFFCPSEGALDMEFTLTAGGGTLTFS